MTCFITICSCNSSKQVDPSSDVGEGDIRPKFVKKRPKRTTEWLILPRCGIDAHEFKIIQWRNFEIWKFKKYVIPDALITLVLMVLKCHIRRHHFPRLQLNIHISAQTDSFSIILRGPVQTKHRRYWKSQIYNLQYVTSLDDT